MIYFELRDKETEAILASNIDDFELIKSFETKETLNISINGYKNCFRDLGNCSIRLIGKDNDDFLSTAKIISRTATVFATLVPILKGVKRDQEVGYKIFFHNLITTHAMLQDEVESILPAERLSQAKTYLDQLAVAKSSLGDLSGDAADSILQISKRVVDLQAQIEGFRVLTNEVIPDYGMHDLKRVLLNIVYPFYQQFGEIGVYVSINIDDKSSDERKVYMDYKLFDVAMHHFFNNAVKYVQPHTPININFDFESGILTFKMQSLRIEKDERETIFKLEQKGKNAGSLAGEGIGMYMVGRALELLGTKMIISSDFSSQEVIGSRPYIRNQFAIELPMKPLKEQKII